MDTELARVRGVVGYNLPKWKVPIDYSAEGDTVAFTYYDEAGNVDFPMTGKKLDTADSTPAVSRVNFVNLDAQGRVTHGFSDIRGVEQASSRAGDDVQLALTDGPLSSFIRSLGLEKLVRYDYQPMFQAALYTPEPIQGNTRVSPGAACIGLSLAGPSSFGISVCARGTRQCSGC